MPWSVQAASRPIKSLGQPDILEHQLDGWGLVPVINAQGVSQIHLAPQLYHIFKRTHPKTHRADGLVPITDPKFDGIFAQSRMAGF